VGGGAWREKVPRSGIGVNGINEVVNDRCAAWARWDGGLFWCAVDARFSGCGMNLGFCLLIKTLRPVEKHLPNSG
jgi:hypothetical protein